MFKWLKKALGLNAPTKRRRSQSVSRRKYSRDLDITSSEREDSYVIEYRLSGYPKKYMENEFSRIAQIMGSHSRYHFVPHITIVGPVTHISDDNITRCVEEFVRPLQDNLFEKGNLLKTKHYVKFETDEGKQVLAIDVAVPSFLQLAKKGMEKRILELGGHTKIFHNNLWHCTIVLGSNGLWNEKVIEAFKQVKHLKLQEMSFIFDRISVIKNKQILSEYSLVTGEFLSREESLDNSKRYREYISAKEALVKAGESFKY